MSWKEHHFARGFRPRDVDAWRASVTGLGLTIFVPPSHPIASATHVRIFFGDDEDAGWALFVPSEPAAGVRALSKAKHGGKFLRARSFPGIDPSYRLPLTALEVQPDPDGPGVALRLPWASSARLPPPSSPVTLSPALVDVLTQVPTGPTASLAVHPAPKPAEPPRSLSAPPAEPRVVPSSSSDSSSKRAARVSQQISLEEAAEYARGMGRRCSIRENSPRKSATGVLLQTYAPVLDGVEITVAALFKIVNDYRLARDLPPVAPPTEAVAA